MSLTLTLALTVTLPLTRPLTLTLTLTQNAAAPIPKPQKLYVSGKLYRGLEGQATKVGMECGHAALAPKVVPYQHRIRWSAADRHMSRVYLHNLTLVLQHMTVMIETYEKRNDLKKSEKGQLVLFKKAWRLGADVRVVVWAMRYRDMLVLAAKITVQLQTAKLSLAHVRHCKNEFAAGVTALAKDEGPCWVQFLAEVRGSQEDGWIWRGVPLLDYEVESAEHFPGEWATFCKREHAQAMEELAQEIVIDHDGVLRMAYLLDHGVLTREMATGVEQDQYGVEDLQWFLTQFRESVVAGSPGCRAAMAATDQRGSTGETLL